MGWLLIVGGMRLSDHTDFRALLSTIPAGCPVHYGQVPNDPAYPYVLVRGGAERPSWRSLNRTVHLSSTRWRVTVAGANSDSVLIVLGQVQDVLEGARVGGKRLEQLPTYEGTDPLMDEDVKLVNGSHPFYAVTEWQILK